jgi:hypothetical protein
MFPITHPDLVRQLVDERIARLRAEAGAARRARGFLAKRRPARLGAPGGGSGRVVPAPAP